EELFVVWFEVLPGRIGNDGVEAAAVDKDVVELVGPVEGAKGFDVGDGQQAFDRLALLLLLFVPGGLLELDPETLEFVEEEFVENLASGAIGGLDLVAQAGEGFEFAALLPGATPGVKGFVDGDKAI